MPITTFPTASTSGTSTLTDAHIFVGNSANIAVDVPMSGDVTIADTGATTIANSAITNVKVSTTAAIARTKLASGTNNSIIFNNSTGVMVDTTLTANRALVSNTDGLLAVSATTDTEIGYVAGATSNIQAQINLKAPKDAPTFTTSITTPLTANSAVVTGASGILATAAWATFSPTVTLVGGSGNAVPQYTNNVGRYLKMGKIVFVQVDLNGDGGTEGAGSGVFTVALPVTAGANSDPVSMFHPIGMFFNNTTDGYIYGQIAASASVVSCHKFSSATALVNMTGADQNNTTRFVKLRFFYEVD